MSQAQQVGSLADTPKVEQPAPPKAPKPALALAAISPEVVSECAKGLARAVVKREKADVSLLMQVVAAITPIGIPLNAPQWAKQVEPYVRASLKKRGVVETTAAGYRSRFKTAGLAILSGEATLQPVAGESLNTYVARVAEPLTKLTLADGSPVWPADQLKTGRPVGTKLTKTIGGASGPQTGGHVDSKGGVDASEGGMNVRPMLAAALICAKGNESRAQRLALICERYSEELDKFMSSVLSDEDKTNLSKRVDSATAQVPSARKAGDAPKPGTLLAAKFTEAVAKKSEKVVASA